MPKITLFVLMKNGLAPTEKSQNLLIERLFPDREDQKLDIVLKGGPTWAAPGKLLEDMNTNSHVATVYTVDGKFFVDHVFRRKRIKQLQQLLAEAAPGEESWDCAMRLHEIESGS